MWAAQFYRYKEPRTFISSGGLGTMGYGLGYIGGSTIPLLIFLVMNAVGVDMLYCLSFIFGFTAVWWAAFSWPLLKNVEQKSYQPTKRAPSARLRGCGPR